MKKSLVLKRPVTLLMVFLCLFSTVISIWSKDPFCWVLSSAVYLFGILTARKVFQASKQMDKLFSDLDDLLAPAQKKLLTGFPLPVIAINKKGEVFWCSQTFIQHICSGKEVLGRTVPELFPKIDLQEACPEKGWQIEFGDKFYSVFSSPSNNEKTSTFLFFVEDDKLKRIAKEYLLSRPAIITIMVDNYSELLENARENERSQLIGELDYLIESFARENKAIYRKLEKDGFLIIMEERYLLPVLEARFPLLDQARKITPDNRMCATLSIGVGYGVSSLKSAEQMASQALDMALGRGGDQAAVKTKNGYDFYGGISKGVEKRTKVRTRIIATALEELILGSSNVLLMGHRFADLDSLGAALGMQGAVARLGKPAQVVLDTEKNLAKSLHQRFVQAGREEVFVEPAEAIDLISDNTLLIIVDTHSPHFLESSEVYSHCKNVVVIDHHRKMVEHIDRAVIFYHEPHSSSASEMVAELVQYLGSGKGLSSLEAEALLAGIMLDTKNFVLRSGVRTFEAAAYLRRLGADTVEVRKLFSSSMEAYQEKSKLVAAAEIYVNCAITMVTEPIADIKIVAAQAADELLGISEVAASFVIYEESEGVAAISARSMGDMNVQIVLERLGGGGHLTMAGVQMANTSLESAYQQLLVSIDAYYEDNNL